MPQLEKTPHNEPEGQNQNLILPIMAIVSLFSLSLRSEAHLLGQSAWCISTSPVHYECFYESQESCQRMIRMQPSRTLPGAKPIVLEAQCAPYPYDFAKDPKSRIPENSVSK